METQNFHQQEKKKEMFAVPQMSQTTTLNESQTGVWPVSPRSDLHGRREACGGGTSTRPEQGPGTARREAAGSTPAH